MQKIRILGRTRHRRTGSWPVWLTCSAWLIRAGSAEATIQVNRETVEQYGSCGGRNVNAAVGDGTNFLNEIFRVNPNHYVIGNNFTDADVWDRDFCDSDLDGNCDDNVSFDPQNTFSISLFEGHGVEILHDNQTPCTSWTQCNNPPAGAQGSFGTCVTDPKNPNGICHYGSNRAMLTCGSNDAFGGNALLTPNQAFGESNAASAWRGARTNGGNLFAIVKVSNGLVPFFPFAEWAPIDAGLLIYGGMMPVNGDTSDGVLNYGSSIAHFYSTNPSGSVGFAYANAINSVNGGNGSCASGQPGHGFNGCGCYVAAAFHSDCSKATSDLNINWSFFTWPAQTASPTCVAWVLACNYNNSQFGWSGIF
jgi:hypothetical protein